MDAVDDSTLDEMSDAQVANIYPAAVRRTLTAVNRCFLISMTSGELAAHYPMIAQILHPPPICDRLATECLVTFFDLQIPPDASDPASSISQREPISTGSKLTPELQLLSNSTYTFAWSIAQRGPFHARLLGISAPVASMLRSIDITDLITAPLRHPVVLTPRWTNHLIYWQQLAKLALSARSRRGHRLRVRSIHLLHRDQLSALSAQRENTIPS